MSAAAKAASAGVPAAERVRVVDILAAVRGDRESDADAADDVTGCAVERLLSELDASASQGVGGQTIAELLAGEGIPEPAETTDRRLGLV